MQFEPSLAVDLMQAVKAGSTWRETVEVPPPAIMARRTATAATDAVKLQDGSMRDTGSINSTRRSAGGIVSRGGRVADEHTSDYAPMLSPFALLNTEDGSDLEVKEADAGCSVQDDLLAGGAQPTLERVRTSSPGGSLSSGVGRLITTWSSPRRQKAEKQESVNSSEEGGLSFKCMLSEYWSTSWVHLLGPWDPGNYRS